MYRVPEAGRKDVQLMRPRHGFVVGLTLKVLEVKDRERSLAGKAVALVAAQIPHQ